ncbi:MAG: nuclear transport factor 2 family protein [Candidatus Dormibacteraeota bacterium]|nr:nuclear transport factor 2 family protein [Candidatus Dormibacteraeota bacterium]
MSNLTDRVRRLNAAVNAHDLNPIGDMYAEDGEFTWPGFPTMKGRQTVIAFYAQIFGAFPDVHVTLTRIVEQGDAVAIEYESRGTNSGPLPLPTGQLPATNKPVVIRAASIGTADANGRIQTQHEYFDQVEILAQLRLLPVPEGAGVSG